MNATQIREALAWIESNVATAPALLHSNLMGMNEKLNKQLSKVALSAELKEKQDELKKTVDESRKAMKELQQKIKDQREIEKKQREAQREERKAANDARKADAEKKKAEREAALIAKAAKLQDNKKAATKAGQKK